VGLWSLVVGRERHKVWRISAAEAMATSKKGGAEAGVQEKAQGLRRSANP
jgi:hypothetical protein